MRNRGVELEERMIGEEETRQRRRSLQFRAKITRKASFKLNRARLQLKIHIACRECDKVERKGIFRPRWMFKNRPGIIIKRGFAFANFCFRLESDRERKSFRDSPSNLGTLKVMMKKKFIRFQFLEKHTSLLWNFNLKFSVSLKYLANLRKKIRIDWIFAE